MSEQEQLFEVLDRVSTHLLSQGERSVIPTNRTEDPNAGGCSYRATTLDGRVLKCAVGCLIADEHYHSEAEGYGMVGIVPKDGVWGTYQAHPSFGNAALCASLNASGVPATYKMRELLDKLQTLHDYEPPATWPARLEAVKVWLLNHAA